MDTQDLDLVVIGAGLSGIAAARFYLEVHPECRLVILEQDSCPGGVWNTRRSYEDNLWTRFVHGTNFGQKIVHAVWGGADKETRAEAEYEGRRDALKGFEDLNPFAPLFWQNGTAGILNRVDFWETVAQNVHIYLDDILEVDRKLIRLKKGHEIASDVLLCGTGWDAASFDFFEPDHLVQLGLPHLHKDEPPKESELWAHLEQQADLEILRQFPMLANPPEHNHRPSPTTPYRLYNGIGPLNDDSIVFIGYSLVTNYFQGVECQAIWATAFLDRKIALPSLEDKQAEVAKMIAYNKRRYLSSGERGNFLAFESNFYLDKLLREVGLSSHLKGWFKNYFVPRTAQDLAGLKDEYLAKYGGGSVKHSSICGESCYIFGGSVVAILSAYRTISFACLQL